MGPAKMLFRASLAEEDELNEAKKCFEVVDSRVGLSDSLVVGRYSCLPFYEELEKDLNAQGSRLINSYKQHQYIADFEYYWDIEDLTPKTWFRLEDSRSYGGPYVLKGKTNSRKHLWSSHMFAATYADAVQTMIRLREDTLLSSQELLFRQYVPLKQFEIGVQGLPVTNEWRCFFLGPKLLSHGYYWSDYPQYGSELAAEGLKVAQTAADILSRSVNFFVVDVAETAEGEWIVVEVNDGQMSGPSLNNLPLLYSNLARELRSFDLGK